MDTHWISRDGLINSSIWHALLTMWQWHTKCRGGVCVPLPWTWVGLCNYLDQHNMVKVTVCVTSMVSTWLLNPFLFMSWVACVWSVATMLWGSLGHMEKPCVDVQDDNSRQAPRLQTSSIARHVSKQTSRCFQISDLGSYIKGPSYRGAGAHHLHKLRAEFLTHRNHN